MKDAQKDILDFWFEQTQPPQWFQVNPAFDATIKDLYEDAYEKAALGIFDDWKKNADGCLALCLLLDQFPRNMYRGTPKAFATDGKGLVVAKYALSKGFDQVLVPMKRRFLYLPFEHSENLNDQRKCVELFDRMKKDDPLGYDYAMRHLKVIEKYGRFPHRNRILARTSTPDEEEYLAQSGAGF
ncbi:MAG: DUF924 domain-containing protein [Micavibrio aeruginosavorus]|uniref:DUF924 domain-containing protein n=1 Tax=Micavibrio aeruginosavorus TaxID=349221 RepID=A0A2W5N0W4_9BACT|nr:MAG: DUF924 domain-containing protein [Micavibrio aeruginosavorus]